MVRCGGEQVLGPIHELDKTCSYIIFELGKSLKKLSRPFSALQTLLLNILNVLIAFYPSLKQNLIQTHCSFKSAIFWIYQNHNRMIHACTEQDVVNNHMFYRHIPSRNWLSRLEVQVSTNNSSPILQSLQKIFDCNTCVLWISWIYQHLLLQTPLCTLFLISHLINEVNSPSAEREWH